MIRRSCLLFVRRFNFAGATANIAAAATSSAASIAVSNANTCDGFLASASTGAAVTGPLAVAFRTQCSCWHRSPRISNRPTL